MSPAPRGYLPIIVIFGLMLAGSGAAAYYLLWGDDGTYTIEVTDHSEPPEDAESLLSDDRIEDKKTVFDPELVNRRPLEQWSVNTSEAVLKLDVPIVLPDEPPELLVLHPSYAAATKASKGDVLPSVNMIDGKAKQFDDGLYASLDQAYYVGHEAAMKSHLKLIRRIYDKVAKGSPASDYLAGGLLLTGEPIEASAAAKSLAKRFNAEEILSKPIAFYIWTPKLSDCFKFRRYFSQPIQNFAIAKELARVLSEDKELRADYETAINFYSKLTNPLVGASIARLIDKPDLAPNTKISLFPPSSSRETELFRRIYPDGIPENADLMRELIAAIRSGKVDLKPRADGGWYDYQVYALETLLLPEKGQETNKLLLTKTYKKRMLEAFKALITKRLETHNTEVKKTEEVRTPPINELEYVQPRLRVEPNPTYYLRTARSYAFLANFLEATLGEATLKSLHGLREDGPRELNLHSELKTMRDLFYGLYFLSAEDIGMKPGLLQGEIVDRNACEKVAVEWLTQRDKDRDLAADTRVAVPIYFDQLRGVTRLWMTVGVRMTPLDTEYVKAPKVRPLDGSKDWKEVERFKLRSRRYLIAVDEFAEVEIRGGRILTRKELRAICDRMKTKEKIVEAIRRN